MRVFLSILVIFVLGQVPFAKAQVIKVFSSVDSKPIPFAHIKVVDLKQKKETTFVSDESGKLNLSIAESTPFKFIITISFLGFEPLTDTISKTEDKIYYLNPQSTALNEFVITAQYSPNSPEKAVHKIKIIDSKKIEAMAAVNLKDVLTNELNIRLSEDNILGSSMSLQGISGQNVKLLIDGVPVTGRLNGNIDISQINMNNVDRIEVVEGPLSVSYGTDALGGTINIITKKSQKETVSFLLNNYYESCGQYNSNAKLGFKKGNSTISVSGGRNFFDGWNSYEEPFNIEKVRIADSLRYKQWKPKEQYFGTLNFSQFIHQLKINYTADYFNEMITNRGRPRKPYMETAFDEYYHTQRINNAINLNYQYSKHYYINMLAAYNIYNRIKSTYLNDLTSLEKVLTESAEDQDTIGFNNLFLRGALSKAKDSTKVNYEIGYDINLETASGRRIENRSKNMSDYALYSSAELKLIDGFVIRPGLRLIYNNIYKAPVVPSINLKYTLPSSSNNKTLTMRGSYARGFRSPSLKELYFYFVDINHNIVGNENLKAENSDNFNFAISYNRNTGERVYKTELSAFYNSISNMISLVQSTGDVYSYFNIDHFKTTGVQLQNEVSVSHFKLGMGAAYIGRNNEMNGIINAKGYLFSPEVRCNIMYEWHQQNTTFSMFYKYTGKFPSYILNADGSYYKNTIQDYHTADFTATRHFFRKRIVFGLGIKNIFDVRNISGIAAGTGHTSSSNSVSVAMGRTYFLKLDFNLASH